jgi:hypothetical protein
MAIPSFFKQNKPRGFNYVPRYYDPEKEEREERLRAWRIEHGAKDMEHPPEGSEQVAESADLAGKKEGKEGQNQPYRSRIMRGDMKNYFHRRKERVERHTTIRLLVIILIIVLVVYLYLHY